MKNLKQLKALDLAAKQVKALNLNLNNLVVLTECASFAYSLTPIIALMAGAKVFAVGRDSSHGTFEQNKTTILEMINLKNLNSSNIEFLKDSVPGEVWQQAHIITNSGFLRPFTADKINQMNSSAIIALMWETWELRDGEIDIEACQKKNIPVIGTNEHYEKADMFGYPGMLAIKLLLEKGLEIINNKIVLLGGGLTGKLIAKTFSDLNLNFDWYTPNGKEEGRPNLEYSDIHKILELDHVDVILCADHVSQDEIIGKKSKINFSNLKNKFPNIEWCHLAGPIDIENLKESNISFFPSNIKPIGYMSYETQNLGWGPVVILNSAGLKVGEIAARLRLKGETIETTIKKTVEYGIGMDFEGGFMNFKHTR